MKGLDQLTWDELGYARAQLVGRTDEPPEVGPFTELAAVMYENTHNKQRLSMLQRISSEAPVLPTERLVAIIALLDNDEEQS